MQSRRSYFIYWNPRTKPPKDMPRRRGAVALLATSACTAFVLHRGAPRAACIRAAESEEESKRSKAKKLWDKLRGKDETDTKPPTLDAVRKSHVGRP